MDSVVYEKRSVELSDKGGIHADNTQAKAGLLFNLPALILNHACQRERLQTEKQADGRPVLQSDTIPTPQINKDWSGPTPFSITPVTIGYFSFSPLFYPAPKHLPKPLHMTKRIKRTRQIATYHGYIKWHVWSGMLNWTVPRKVQGAIFRVWDSPGQYSHWAS